MQQLEPQQEKKRTLVESPSLHCELAKYATIRYGTEWHEGILRLAHTKPHRKKG
jgi:hypothetical protein